MPPPHQLLAPHQRAGCEPILQRKLGQNKTMIFGHQKTAIIPNLIKVSDELSLPFYAFTNNATFRSDVFLEC